jgi:hypothetical protein
LPDEPSPSHVFSPLIHENIWFGKEETKTSGKRVQEGRPLNTSLTLFYDKCILNAAEMYTKICLKQFAGYLLNYLFP